MYVNEQEFVVESAHDMTAKKNPWTISTELLSRKYVGMFKEQIKSKISIDYSKSFIEQSKISQENSKSIFILSKSSFKNSRSWK